MSKKLNDSLINEEDNNHQDNNEFIENILSENTFLFKESNNKLCKCNICTKIPLFFCFFIIASLFLVILLSSFLIIGIFLMKSLYKEINDLYFTNFVIDPIINKKTNSTQSFNIKNEVLDSIYLESKLNNMQIATEFILDNLENYENEMIKDKSDSTFNCIQIDSNDGKPICKDDSNIEENKNIEDNYYIYTKNYNNDFNPLFLGLTHYLKLFENNLKFVDIFGNEFLNIKEYFFYLENNDINPFQVLLTYCSNLSTENGLIEDIFKSSNFNNIINENKNILNINITDINTLEQNETNFNFSNSFVEYIVNNDFNMDQINQLNYLKMKLFSVIYKNISYNVLLGIRLDSDSINKLFNKQNSNMTTIAPISKLTSQESSSNNKSELHLLYCSNYFSDFFDYGIKNLISEVNSMRTNQEYEEILEYESTNITTFFEIMNKNNYSPGKENGLQFLYNSIWKDDFITIIKLIVDIIGIHNLPKLDCNNNNDEFYKILCDVYKINNKEENEINYTSIKNKKDDYVSEDLNKTSVYIHQKLKEIGRTKIYYTLESNAFTDLLEKKSNTKIFYYNSSVNNISFNSIEVLNITTYNNLKEEFIKEMDNIESIVIYIRAGFIIIFLIMSLIKIIREVMRAIKRIKSIISLKDMLFNKTDAKTEEDKETLDFLNNDKDNAFKISSKINEKVEDELLEGDKAESISDKDEGGNNFLLGNTIEIEKEKNKIKEKYSKIHFYDDDFMDEGNKLIIQYTYNKLKNIFENMDFFQNEKFAEKLVFLKRRYKLNEQYEDKDDCELSSDIYQAISKISMINMDDIYYNVYYNQSYALNQAFKMFKSIMDNSINKQSIPLRNNKYINFGRILKFIYFIKKEKIQKIIEIIYGKDLKYKSKSDDDKNIDNNFNNFIQTARINSPNKLGNQTKSSIFPS
jgi:hypothetical protein